jgi:TPR repeat protein
MGNFSTSPAILVILLKCEELADIAVQIDQRFCSRKHEIIKQQIDGFRLLSLKDTSEEGFRAFLWNTLGIENREDQQIIYTEYKKIFTPAPLPLPLPSSPSALSWICALPMEDFQSTEARRLRTLAIQQLDTTAVVELGKAYYYADHLIPLNLENAFNLFKIAADLGDSEGIYQTACGYGTGKGISKGLSLFHLAIERGNVGAINGLAWCYEYGEGVPQDKSEAIRLYMIAFEKGNLRALVNLGQLYENSKVLGKDPKKAFELYQLGHERHYRDATYYLGRCYEHSIGVEKDMLKASEYYHIAAEAGCSSALARLGFFYRKGIPDANIPKDWTISLSYYQQAIEKGNSDAMVWLADVYRFGWDDVEKNIQEAIVLYERAALEYNDGTAAYNVAKIYRHGMVDDGIQTDILKCIRFYELGVQLKDSNCMIALGIIYQDGVAPVIKEEKKAFELFWQAMELENSTGYLNVGLAYYHAVGVEKDVSLSVKYLRLAVEKDDSRACAALAVLFQTGDGVEKDIAESVRLLKLGAKEEDGFCLFYLAECYLKGRGVDINVDEAMRLYKLASEQDNRLSVDRLRQFS